MMFRASSSISPASVSSTTPAHGTGSRGTSSSPPEQNVGSVRLTGPQVLMTYMNTVGRPVTNQTQTARRVFHSQTVTPKSVSAASNWLLAPNSAQNDRHTGGASAG